MSSHTLAEKPDFLDLERRTAELGGFSALDFKGLFIVFLPKVCQLDVAAELDRIAGISKWKRGYLTLKRKIKQRFKRDE